VEEGRRRTDVVELLPATMKIADMVPDSPGSWLFHCHVAEHMKEGMFSQVVVHPKGTPGVSKSPEVAFFGVSHSQQSLRITKAECTADLTKAKATRGELRFEGTVSVSDAFSVFTAPVQVKLGAKLVKLQPAMNGTAHADGTTLTITNSGRYGVVYGGLMEFRVTLEGADWLEEARKSAQLAKATANEKVRIPIELTVGSARHEAELQLGAAGSRRK
jgi:hypothetical protein